MKKIVSLMLACVMLVCTGISAFAAEPSIQFVDLSPVPPTADGGISVYGFSPPSEDNYVDLRKEVMEFSGDADATVLYTNKCFTGKTKIGYTITNNSSSRLTVKLYDKANWLGASFDKIVVEGNATLTGTYDGLKADHFYYLSFSTPNHCKGSVY